MSHILDTRTQFHERLTGDEMYEEQEEIVRVAAGIIRDAERMLICQRGINRRYGLKWEFPGGKIIPGESVREALERELWEELDIEPVQAKELKTIQAVYPDGGNFLITFFIVTEYSGDIKNKVFEAIKWVTSEEISNYELLEGSLPILPHLK